MAKIKIKLLSKEAIMPKKAHPDDAGFDVFVPRETQIKPGRQIIPLDIAIELPKWHQAQIEPRSGFSSKGVEGYAYFFDDVQTKVRLSTQNRFDADVIHGKIDCNFRGNIGVIVKSYEKRPFYLEAGTKIAQMTIYELSHIDGFELTDTLSETDRGEGGFGSTGSKL